MFNEASEFGTQNIIIIKYLKSRNVAETKLFITSTLHVLTVGPKFTRPACHMQPTMQQNGWTAADVDRTRARTQQQTGRTSLLLAIDGTDKRTDRHRAVT